MARTMRHGPTMSPLGFDFPPYDILAGGSVPGSVAVLDAALLVRRDMRDVGGALQGIDTVIRHELLRLAATLSHSPEEAGGKLGVMTRAAAEGLGMTARGQAMLEAALIFDWVAFHGPLPTGAAFAKPIRSSADFISRVRRAGDDPIACDQREAVTAMTSSVRLQSGPAVASPVGRGADAGRVLVLPSEALRLPLRNLLERAAALDGTIEDLVHIGEVSRGRLATTLSHDLALMIAAADPSGPAEARRCASHLAAHLRAFGEMACAITQMLSASIEASREAWGIPPAAPPSALRRESIH